jgi:hypothetical protein
MLYLATDPTAKNIVPSDGSAVDFTEHSDIAQPGRLGIQGAAGDRSDLPACESGDPLEADVDSRNGQFAGTIRESEDHGAGFVQKTDGALNANNLEKGRIHRVELLGLRREAFGDHFVFLNRFGRNVPDFMRDYYVENGHEYLDCAVAFPEFETSDPDEALELWKHFNLDDHEEISENSWIPPFDRRLADLAQRGYTAGYLYDDRIPERFRSLPFCWILERIIAWVLKLDIHFHIERKDLDYFPMLPDLDDLDAAWEIAPGNPDAIAPMTPLLIECFRRSYRETGKIWVPGWGSCPSETIQSWDQKHRELILKQEVPDSLARARSLEYVLMGNAFVNDPILNEALYDLNDGAAKARCNTPLCVNFEALQTVNEEWIDLASIPDFWVPQSGEEGIASALKKCCTSLHMPSIRLIQKKLDAIARNEDA